MLNRCYNKNEPAYPRYGGRGIKVDTGWRSFEKFYEDMGERPANLTLERLDNNGDYCPRNCVWATRKAQARNRRTSKLYNGKTLAEWSEITGLLQSTLWNRLNLQKLPFEVAITRRVHCPVGCFP